MTLTRVVQPFLRNRSRLLEYNKLVYLELLKRYKTDKSAITKSVRTEVGTDVKPLGEKVKETTKTATYVGVILIGLGVTGSLFYAVFSELFSSKSPNNVYKAASKKCIEDTRVEDKLGYPLMAYGEETKRRRRQHPSYILYTRDGKQYLRMRFYLQGKVHKGTVNLEMVEDDSGKYEYRYMYVKVDDMFQSIIVVEDNRNKLELKNLPSSLDISFNE